MVKLGIPSLFLFHIYYTIYDILIRNKKKSRRSLLSCKSIMRYNKLRFLPASLTHRCQKGERTVE